MQAGGNAFRPDHKFGILTGNDDLHPPTNHGSRIRSGMTNNWDLTPIFKAYANTTLVRPVVREREGLRTTIWTSRPNRFMHSSILASLMPRN